VRLSQVRLLVGDYVRCFSFYRDVLGFEVTFGDPASGYATLNTGGGGTVALFDRAEQQQVVELRPAGDGTVLAFEVDDVDAFYERHDDVMIGPPRDRADWGIRVAYLRDPDGNLLEIHHQIAME
jgi:catechol 2,3-dioxygenase-like lactoylglutathione lyase family enzyme